MTSDTDGTEKASRNALVHSVRCTRISNSSYFTHRQKNMDGKQHSHDYLSGEGRSMGCLVVHLAHRGI